MIFAAKNEEGISTCELVLSKKKIVTRRLLSGRIYEEGKDYAVQSGRCKKQVARIKILSGIPHIDWWEDKIQNLSYEEQQTALEEEARKEGFNSWYGLMSYFIKKKNMPMNMIRYEFELMN